MRCWHVDRPYQISGGKLESRTAKNGSFGPRLSFRRCMPRSVHAERAPGLDGVCCWRCLAARHGRRHSPTLQIHGSNTVSVIDTATNAVVGAPIAVGGPRRRVNPTARRQRSNVSVIDTATNTVVGAPIRWANQCVAVNPAGTRVIEQQHRLGDRHRDQHRGRDADPGGHLPHRRRRQPGRHPRLRGEPLSDTVSVIDTATNTVVGRRSRWAAGQWHSGSSSAPSSPT